MVLLGILCTMVVCFASIDTSKYSHYPEQMVTSGVGSYTGGRNTSEGALTVY